VGHPVFHVHSQGLFNHSVKMWYLKQSAYVWDVTLLLPVKGKAIPAQARTGPEGSRRLRLPDLKTIGT
jgi:hypothetical protein